MKAIAGRAWVFGDDVNTDVIHPPEFFSLDREIVKRGLFNGLNPNMHARVEPGDILVCGRNFGCGSSRETSIQSLKLNEVGAIVAVDFARIFFRSATNNALPCLRFADPADRARIRPGQRLDLDLDDCRLCTEDGDTIALEPPGAFVRMVWEAGGLIEAAKLGGMSRRPVAAPAGGEDGA